MKWKERIPKKFWYKDNQPRTSTVKGLIKILQELPPNMKLDTQKQITVYNIDYPDRCVGIDEY